MTQDFELDPRLERDLVELGDFDLCKVMAMPSEYNPWVVLAPKRAAMTEWHQLSKEELAQLQVEISKVSIAMESLFSPTTLNVGALGNIVRQLHIHIIARFETDPSWPGPVWGNSRGQETSKIDSHLEALKNRMFPTTDSLLSR